MNFLAVLNYYKFYSVDKKKVDFI